MYTYVDFSYVQEGADIEEKFTNGRKGSEYRNYDAAFGTILNYCSKGFQRKKEKNFSFIFLFNQTVACKI
jgi:hypothetical protein